MGKYSTLRTFMRRFKTVKEDHVLVNCSLVIEGDSFFRQTYKDSGCNFILGGEFDRYADYLKTILMSFIESNVTCYIILNGAMKADIEKRKVIHKKIIDDRDIMTPGDDKYYEPIFMKDVYKQVLDELGIRYCVVEYDARETLLDASEELNCPVLTNNIEQSLLGMSCIIPSSLVYDNTKKQITCKILTPEAYKDHLRIYDNMKPLFFTILDENGPLYDKIPEIIGSNPNMPVGPLLYWIKGQKLSPAINKLTNLLNTEAEKQTFRDSVEELRKMIFYNRQPNVALRYLKGELTVLNNNERDWFRNGVMTGRIANPYINLKMNGIFSGSWVVFEQSKRDAMLPALDIAMYAYSVLWNSQENVTFVGRMRDSVYIGNIASRDAFQKFVNDAIPGFDWPLLQSMPEDCWLLIITLVYYISKTDRKFITSAYSILLSYVMLGAVSQQVGLIKKSKIVSCNLDSDNQEEDSICSYNDCLNAAKAMMDYFYEGNIKDTFDRSLLHDLAEFQHCLQHINYLNKLCGEKIKCTHYYKTYNGTLIFNVLLQLREHDNPMLFFESNFKKSPSVLNFYNCVKNVLDSILSQIRVN